VSTEPYGVPVRQRVVRISLARVVGLLGALAVASGAEIAYAATGHDVVEAVSHGKPVVRDAPSSPPSMQRRHHTCFESTPAHEHRGKARGVVWVRRAPTSIEIVWIPGLNSTRCRSEITHSGRHAARKLATGVERAERVGKGMYNCPEDDATRARLYLSYPHGRTEYVGVALAGCRMMSAPNRAARWPSTRVARVLARHAPKPWRRYFPRR
jgi:hypothetical protein